MVYDKHSFSIEMNSKSVNKISIDNVPNNEIFIEGELGRLLDIELIEGGLLQITGVNGTLRIDIAETELKKVVNKTST